MKNIKRAVCYIRTTNETEDFRTNLNKLREYCKSNNLKLSESDIFVDENISGTTDVHERDGLKELVKRVEQGNIDVVLAVRLEQLFRNQRKLLSFIDFLTRHHVACISTTQTFDTSNASGRLMFQIISSLAEHERMMTKKCSCNECCCCLSRLNYHADSK